MCNCGKKRNSINVSARSVAAPVQIKMQQGVAARSEAPLNAPNQTILFRYVGSTALSIIGRVTRKSYRFNFPGDTKPVAIVDAPDMKAVPVLKMVE